MPDDIGRELRAARGAYIDLLRRLDALNAEILAKAMPSPDGSYAVSGLGKQLRDASRRYRAAIQAVAASIGKQIDCESNLDRSSLEELWHNRLNEARFRLDLAHNYAINLRASFPAILTSVERFAVAEAIRAESVALTEHSRILRIYADLVIDGKDPYYPPPSERAG